MISLIAALLLVIFSEIDKFNNCLSLSVILALVVV